MNYLERYSDGNIYDTLTYGSPYVSKGLKFAKYISSEIPKGEKILCVGCGNGYEVIEFLNNGFDAYGTELHDIDVPKLKGRIHKAVVPNLPFKDKEFFLLSCTEVLEHVPEEETDDFIRECLRVAKVCMFSIATVPDPPYNTHINIKHPTWWLLKFQELGCSVTNFQYPPVIDNLIEPKRVHRMRFSSGVLIIVQDIQKSE